MQFLKYDLEFLRMHLIEPRLVPQDFSFLNISIGLSTQVFTHDIESNMKYISTSFHLDDSLQTNETTFKTSAMVCCKGRSFLLFSILFHFLSCFTIKLLKGIIFPSRYNKSKILLCCACYWHGSYTSLLPPSTSNRQV